MEHGWHKRTGETYLLVLQAREADQVTSLGLSLLQCHPGLIQVQHPPEYAANHKHHQWHRVFDPDNSGTPAASGKPPVTVQDV